MKVELQEVKVGDHVRHTQDGGIGVVVDFHAYTDDEDRVESAYPVVDFDDDKGLIVDPAWIERVVPVYMTPYRIIALENLWHTAMNTPGDDHDRAEIEHLNEVADIIAEARGEE